MLHQILARAWLKNELGWLNSASRSPSIEPPLPGPNDANHADLGVGLVGFFHWLRQDSPTPEAVRLHENAIRFGTALVVLGTFATLLADLSHWRTLDRFRRKETSALSHWPRSIAAAMLLAIIGSSNLWSLLQQLPRWESAQKNARSRNPKTASKSDVGFWAGLKISSTSGVICSPSTTSRR